MFVICLSFLVLSGKISDLRPHETSSITQTEVDALLSGRTVDDEQRPFSELVAEFEKNVIVNALSEHNGNVTQTAKTLGMHRKSLQRKMKKYEISRQP